MNNENGINQVRKNAGAKARRLEGEYKKVYIRTKHLLLTDVQNGIDRINALAGLTDMLTEASERKQPLSELFPDGYDAFYHELIYVLPIYSAESKQRKSRHKRIGYITIATMCFILISIIVLWNLGYVGLWTKGIAYPAGNLNAYSYSNDIDTHAYTVTVSLSDLESNAGKILYDDGECSITVDKVDFVGIDGGGYRVQLRSHGAYSIDTARLVSGLAHYSTEERSFSTTMTAKMTAEYNGKTYECEIMGQSMLNYKDGDAFNYYIFPYQAYDNNEIPQSDAGDVSLSVTNLCVNRWSKK